MHFHCTTSALWWSKLFWKQGHFPHNDQNNQILPYGHYAEVWYTTLPRGVTFLGEGTLNLYLSINPLGSVAQESLVKCPSKFFRAPLAPAQHLTHKQGQKQPATFEKKKKPVSQPPGVVISLSLHHQSRLFCHCNCRRCIRLWELPTRFIFCRRPHIPSHMSTQHG